MILLNKSYGNNIQLMAAEGLSAWARASRASRSSAQSHFNK